MKIYYLELASWDKEEKLRGPRVRVKSEKKKKFYESLGYKVYKEVEV